MKTIMLLSMIVLSSCAKSVPKMAPTDTVEANCFAPAGFYMGVAGLQKHDCKIPPKETVVFPLELAPNSLSCGVHRRKTQTKDGWITTIIGAAITGVNGRIIVETKECKATYDVVFLRMK